MILQSQLLTSLRCSWWPVQPVQLASPRPLAGHRFALILSALVVVEPSRPLCSAA